MAKIKNKNEKKVETRETLTRKYPVLAQPLPLAWTLRILLAIAVFLLTIFWGLWIVVGLVNLVIRGFMAYFQIDGQIDQNIVFWISRILGLVPGVILAWIVDREVYGKPFAKLREILKNEGDK